MTYTLTTAVSAVIDRVLLMQAAIIATSTNEVKDWIHWEQEPPYWVNRPARLIRTDDAGGYYDLEMTMRLILAHISEVKTDYGDGTTPQARAWTYIPEVIAYFETYDRLNMPGQTELTYLAPQRLTISCNTGADIVSLPGQSNVSYKADFELTIPLLIMEQYGGN